MELLKEAIFDTTKDTALLVPFLFLTYLVMEWMESKTEDHSITLLSKMGMTGCVVGAGIGLVPQCGFSAAAASLYSGGVITTGTLLAVFLSTSDEMLPIFISSAVSPAGIIKLLAAKFVIACICGIIMDALLAKVMSPLISSDKDIHELCERDECGCGEEGGSILRPALVHTIKICIFIFIASLVISILTMLLGKEAIASILGGAPLIGTIICGIVGLIPNCAASVIIAELYLEGLISSGQLLAGLAVGAGVGILVLARTNQRPKENVFIIGVLFAAGVISGLVIDALHITF